MNNISDYNGNLRSSNVRSSNKTENGTPIVMPGEESDKNLFLKMLVAQMTNQDPFNPQDPTEYITQLSQFTMLEQMMSFNDGMEYLLSMQNGILVNSALSTATSLIGKNVEVYLPSEDETQKTATGVVESVYIKDGTVYLDLRLDENGELKSFEYGSFKKVSNTTISNENIENKGE